MGGQWLRRAGTFVRGTRQTPTHSFQLVSNFLRTRRSSRTESHEHPHAGSDFEASHSGEQVIFVYFYADTVTKTSVGSVVISYLFQSALLPDFDFQTIHFSSKIHPYSPNSPPFRRTFGRSLLAWVQSFLI